MRACVRATRVYLGLGVDHVLPVVEQLQLHLVQLLLEGLAGLAVLNVLGKKKKWNGGCGQQSHSQVNRCCCC